MEDGLGALPAAARSVHFLIQINSPTLNLGYGFAVFIPGGISLGLIRGPQEAEMATLLRPEENARSVLGIYEHFKIRLYGVLRVKDFLAIMKQKGLRSDDINTGITYCLKVRWLENVGDDTYLLTGGGCAAIGHAHQRGGSSGIAN